jgi:hypothetical protein
VSLERGPLSLVRITEELLEWKSSGFGLENREYGRGDPLRWPRDTVYQPKLALTSPISGGRSVGIFRLRTNKTTEFVCFVSFTGLHLMRTYTVWTLYLSILLLLVLETVFSFVYRPPCKNTKIDRSNTKDTAVPLNFSAPDDGRVGRNM